MREFFGCFDSLILLFSGMLQEPELLRVDAERIQRQMQEVAVGNYRAFIAAADALLAIREEVSSIDKHLGSLVSFDLIRRLNEHYMCICMLSVKFYQFFCVDSFINQIF